MTICRAGWVAKVQAPRSFTDALKLKQLAERHASGKPSAYEEDNLIPLELGGAARDPRNLWPESRPRAVVVDRIEMRLRTLVCAGKLTLAQARRQISRIKYTQG